MKHSYNIGENFVIDELNQIEDNEKKENSYNQGEAYGEEPEPENKDMEMSKSLTNKSNKYSQSESNLERFKSLEKASHRNSKISGKMSNYSKNNSISVRSKISKGMTEERYKGEEDDILNDIERSQNSRKNEENSEMKISEKANSRINSIKNDEENKEKSLVAKDEPKEEENE